VALARALAPRPRLLLLDEPLSALDAKLRQSLRLEIQAVQRELAVTTVYVTHDQEEALAISDRIAVMREGRIEQLGSPEEVYRRPASLFVAGFIGQANLIPGRVLARDGRLTVLQTALGRFAAVGKTPAAGERRVLFFRPEAARLGRKAGNRFHGRILRREYLGSQVQAVVQAGDQRLVLSAPQGPGKEVLPAGGRVEFAVDPLACWLLPEEPASTTVG
jgi:ABC-type Fe3+/spermidine/putrescine transport system ATPase subunit